MSSLHYFANRYRNRVSRKREFFNLYKTVFVILNMQKSHKISLFKILQLFYHVASQTSSIFTCNICTKYRGLFPGYFLTAYALRAVILLAFLRSFQRVPWHINSILTIFYLLSCQRIQGDKPLFFNILHIFIFNCFSFLLINEGIFSIALCVRKGVWKNESFFMRPFSYKYNSNYISQKSV